MLPGPTNVAEPLDLLDADTSAALGFNLTIEEVRIVAKYRALSRHQQRGILQAIELIRPATRTRTAPHA